MCLAEILTFNIGRHCDLYIMTATERGWERVGPIISWQPNRTLPQLYRLYSALALQYILAVEDDIR